jgi:hypothetical protein
MDTPMILYHGSRSILKKPVFGQGEAANDYGRGFYLTEYYELAAEWACPFDNVDGIVNKYELELTELNLLDLDKEPIEHWVSLLVQNRDSKMGSGARERMEKFVKQYPFNVSDYDVVKGWRADDSYFAFVRAFFGVGLSLESLRQAMRLGDYGTQYCLVSERSFDKIKYVSHETAVASNYNAKRILRDNNAKKQYSSMPNKTSGTLIIDIIGRD